MHSSLLVLCFCIVVVVVVVGEVAGVMDEAVLFEFVVDFIIGSSLLSASMSISSALLSVVTTVGSDNSNRLRAVVIEDGV